MIGTKLAHYEITSHIGSGGMGDVYQATDSKLGRSVAIKFLPETFSHDTERVARFQREARVLASLNHTNIAGIYGVEEIDGRHFLVMELVAGETLAERINRGPIPVEEALPIAKQIAEALEEAHEKGIIHRDLKPANIKLTLDGKVKVLDFGLAKAYEREHADASVSNSPTISMAATNAGVILGTASYMSPEQASGKRVDKRADIWSFGVVLWEMLTGKRLFEGETVSHTLADVLRAEIDFKKLPSTTPAPVRELLKRCLDRDVKTRLRDIGEARIVLGRPAARAVSAPLAPRRFRWVWPSAMAGLLAVAVIALVALLRPATRPVEHPFMNLSVDLGADAALGVSIGSSTLALSPDGKRLVFSSVSGGKQHLSIRLLDQAKATPVAGTENARDPFFSPDGEWLGFFADGKLKKISLRGGDAMTLCNVADGLGGAWGEDGNIVFGMRRGSLARVSENGGTPQALTQLDIQKREQTHRFPHILPGGQAVLFTANSTEVDMTEATLEVVLLKTGERKTLLSGGYYGRYLPASEGTAGHLLYMLVDTLYGVPLDLDKLAPIGPGSPVLEGVATNAGSGSTQFDVSRAGTMVYVGSRFPAWSFVWLNGAGKTQPLQPTPGLYVTPSFSPDGTLLAFGSGLFGGDIWISDLQRDTQQRLSSTPGVNTTPVWTPDGRGIVYRSRSGGTSSLYWIRSDGAAEAVKLVESKTDWFPYSFSPDAKRLAYHDEGGAGGGDIWTLPIDWSNPDHPKAGKPEPFLQGPEGERYPAFSPDGHWLAYAAGSRVNSEILVRPFPANPSGGKWQISNGGGISPVWSRTGRELFFQRLAGRPPVTGIMVASYTTKDTMFVPEKPRLWVDHLINITTAGKTYDLAPDGKRFAVIEAPHDVVEQTPDTHVNLLLNYSEELRRRMESEGK